MLTRFALRPAGRTALRSSFCRSLATSSSTDGDAKTGRPWTDLFSTAAPTKLVKRKVAIVTGYMGTGYHGLQLNENVKTIEDDIRHAIFQAGAMRESNFEDLGKIDWARSSRTDKGVHAGCIVFSGKLLIDEENKMDPVSGRVNGLKEALNASLPENIRVFSCTRVSKRFSARKNCVLREYEYFMPLSFLKDSLIGSDGADFDTDEAVASSVAHCDDTRECTTSTTLPARGRISTRGTHAVDDYSEESSQFEDEEELTRKLLPRHRRSIYSCSGTLVPDFGGEPHLRVHIVGQAFLLNQIRCMVGGALAVATKGMSRVEFDAALLTNRIVRVPIAPAEGLVLLSSSFGGKSHTVSLYEDPNTVLAKERKDVVHRILLNPSEDEEMRKFREEVIYKEVASSWDLDEKMDRWRSYLERCYESNGRLDEDELSGVLYELDQAKLATKNKNQSYVEQNRFELTEYGRQGALLPKQFATKLCVRYSVAPGIFTSDLRRAVTRHLKAGKIPLDADDEQIMAYIDSYGPGNLAKEGRKLRLSIRTTLATMFGGFGGDGNPFGVQFNFGDFPQRFDEHYRVYPVSFCDKAHLEDGDKTLETLARLHIEYPMLFKVTNEGVERSSHCGVLEFSAPEGSCYMPYWMMQNLFVKEGGILNIQNVSLPKATFVKLRPQSQDFLDISNPRAVYVSFRRIDMSCVYNNKNYMLDVREVKPAPAACIIETDCEVDFEPPADYVPPVPPSAAAAPPRRRRIFLMEPARLGGAGFGGGLRLKKSGEKSSTDAAALRAARLRKYEAFHGTGHSLSGKTSAFSGATTGGTRLGGSSNGGYSLNESSSSSSSNGSSTTASKAKQSMGHRLNGEAVSHAMTRR
ncbi:Pseudouridine synthase, catalytic domain [Phytophthora cactorum]|nr:Pseudouridine synthase, catalytic domain [Phytophthora cactorum]